MPSGLWIRLGDTHVNLEAQGDEPEIVARCLRNLYKVHTIPDMELEIHSAHQAGLMSGEQAVLALIEEDYYDLGNLEGLRCEEDAL